MERIRRSFEQQGFMRTLGAQIESIDRGTVTLTCSSSDALTQQHGLLHGGALASLADVACGYAAMTMAPDDREVLTVEFKINFVRPANTAQLIAVGKVIHAGRTLTICDASVFDATRTRLLAKMTATIISVERKVESH